MRVFRVYHAGRDPLHRARERGLAALGIEVTLVVPSTWPESGAQVRLSDEPFEILELPVRRTGDVNRYAYADTPGLRRLIADRRPDVLDLHEEPVSGAARQWLGVAGDLPVAMYTAQNVDKRFPPPFAQYETAAFRRADALYPCSRQAAAVARGKGFAGLVDVLPLGVESFYTPGQQRLDGREVRLGLVGRLVPEKGVLDAVRVLAELRGQVPARLTVVGEGPEAGPARALARQLGVADALDLRPWQSGEELARLYKELHVLLVPSRATDTWVEQFGRIIVEGQASGTVIAGYASGAIPEVAEPAAVLVGEGDFEALACAVRALAADPQRYTTLRQRGLEQAARAAWPAVAARQAELYERLVTDRRGGQHLPRSGRARRQLAEEEFGPVATLRGGVRRPFALPHLRKNTAFSRALGRAVDLGLEVVGR